MYVSRCKRRLHWRGVMCNLLVRRPLCIPKLVGTLTKICHTHTQTQNHTETDTHRPMYTCSHIAHGNCSHGVTFTASRASILGPMLNSVCTRWGCAAGMCVCVCVCDTHILGAQTWAIWCSRVAVKSHWRHPARCTSRRQAHHVSKPVCVCVCDMYMVRWVWTHSNQH